MTEKTPSYFLLPSWYCKKTVDLGLCPTSIFWTKHWTFWLGSPRQTYISNQILKNGASSSPHTLCKSPGWCSTCRNTLSLCEDEDQVQHNSNCWTKEVREWNCDTHSAAALTANQTQVHPKIRGAGRWSRGRHGAQTRANLMRAYSSYRITCRFWFAFAHLIRSLSQLFCTYSIRVRLLSWQQLHQAKQGRINVRREARGEESFYASTAGAHMLLYHHYHSCEQQAGKQNGGRHSKGGSNAAETLPLQAGTRGKQQTESCTHALQFFDFSRFIRE